MEWEKALCKSAMREKRFKTEWRKTQTRAGRMAENAIKAGRIAGNATGVSFWYERRGKNVEATPPTNKVSGFSETDKHINI